MNSLARHPLLSVDEYLALEENSTIRHEFVDGHLYALAGASERHNAIVLNVAAALKEKARGSECRVRTLELQLRVTDTRYYYPDVLFISGPSPVDNRFVTNPCVLVEVLSPSTAQIDLREKLFAYQTIPTLRAYYVIHQDAMTVENHWRDDDGAWWHGTLHETGALRVPCLNATLPLAEIFDGVTFDTPPQSP